MPKGRNILAVVCSLLLAGVVLAANPGVAPVAGTDAISIPQLINYQGYLTDAGGTALNGNYNMTYAIYDVATGGTAVWTETQTGVEVTDGVFNVILGSVTAITGIPDGPDCYLEITVGTEVIAPRVRLVSVPYSYGADVAADAEALGGVAPSGYALVSHPHDAGDITSGIFPVARGGTGLGTAGSNGQVLTVVSGAPAWQTPASGSQWTDAGTYIYANGNSNARVYDNGQSYGVYAYNSSGTATSRAVYAYAYGQGSAAVGAYWGGTSLYAALASGGTGSYVSSVYGYTSYSDIAAVRGYHGANGCFGVLGAYYYSGLLANAGVYGYGGASSSYYGVYGYATYIGIRGQNNVSSSLPYYAGVYGYGTNSTGVYGYGYYYGVYGYSGYSSTIYAGVYGRGYYTGGHFTNSYSGYARVGYQTYKVYGSGSVSTFIIDEDNYERALACPEAPEVVFEDYGSARLADGYCRVDLDPLLLRGVTINEEFPLRVFVTVKGTEPVPVAAQSGDSYFEVFGPEGSSASFDWRIVANRKDFTNFRFAKYERPDEFKSIGDHPGFNLAEPQQRRDGSYTPTPRATEPQPVDEPISEPGKTSTSDQ